MARKITPARARRSTKALRRIHEQDVAAREAREARGGVSGGSVTRRGKVDVQIGPDMKKPGAVKNMVVGLTLGTILFFLVSWIVVYGQHLHH